MTEQMPTKAGEVTFTLEEWQKHIGKPALCGAPDGLEWRYADAGHARISMERNDRLQPCPLCWIIAQAEARGYQRGIERAVRHPGWTEAGHAWLDAGAPVPPPRPEASAQPAPFGDDLEAMKAALLGAEDGLLYTLFEDAGSSNDDHIVTTLALAALKVAQPAPSGDVETHYRTLIDVMKRIDDGVYASLDDRAQAALTAARPIIERETVDAVARAIYLTSAPEGARWECVDPHYQETVWRVKARALLDSKDVR